MKFRIPEIWSECSGFTYKALFQVWGQSWWWTKLWLLISSVFTQNSLVLQVTLLLRPHCKASVWFWFSLYRRLFWWLRVDAYTVPGLLYSFHRTWRIFCEDKLTLFSVDRKPTEIATLNLRPRWQLSGVPISCVISAKIVFHSGLS